MDANSSLPTVLSNCGVDFMFDRKVTCKLMVWLVARCLNAILVSVEIGALC